MRLKYRLKEALQFIAFAFYPKTTLVACTVFSAIIVALLGVMMVLISQESAIYDLIFALTTGAVGSFFVSIVVELSGNYKHNKLAWYELRKYYAAVVDFETYKQVLMGHTTHQRAEKKAHDEFVAAGGVEDLDELDEQKDIIQATWEQLPKIIPVLQQTLEHKKAFLSDSEIDELSNIISDFREIRSEIHFRVMPPLLHNALNHPDETALAAIYPQNIVEDMPEWMKKHIASNESQSAIERLTDAILADHMLLSFYMREYDISQHGLESYHSPYAGEDYEPEIMEDDEAYDFSEPEDEESFKAMHDEFNKQTEIRNIPFVSWHISQCCANIAESIGALEKCILRKPYYSFMLKYNLESEKAPLGDPISSLSYAAEKKRLEKKLKRQKEAMQGESQKIEDQFTEGE